MATDLANLQSIRSNLLASLASETTYQQVYGPRSTYSLDGESYQWTEWREAIVRKITQLNLLIQQEQPFWVSSRGRS